MLKILGRTTSINVRKVLWLCAELDLEFEQENWGAGFQSTQTAEFLALNPNALVPVLRDGDFVLWESNAICRYLAARERRTDLLPDEPRQRGYVDQWMDWQATTLNGSWYYAFLALVRRNPEFTDKAAIAASAANWNRQMTILDAVLERTGAYVTGPTFTLADIVVGLSTHRWRATPIEHAKLPAVTAYYQRLLGRDPYRRLATADLA